MKRKKLGQMAFDSVSRQPPRTRAQSKTFTAQESKEELKAAIRGSSEVLARGSTIPVLTLVPDSFVLDRAKLTITKRWFFRMAETASLRIEDILSVNCSVGPFFGSVKVVGRIMNDEQAIEIGPFWRNDAERIKHITQGYIIAQQRKIDTSALQTDELSDMLDRLGQDADPRA